MPPLNRFSPYLIAAAVFLIVTFYYISNVRSKNSDLERNVKIFKEALIVSKEKNKVLVKDALEKIEKKDVRINQLEQENLSKHTKLGETQTKLTKIKSQLLLQNEEITKLHQLAADHKAEISTLTKSVSKSKEVLTKLSGKADHLMLDHKKLKKENTGLQQQNEKLQNDIKKQQSERQTLDEQLNALKKEKEDLGIKVDDLTRKNEMIQESIKQKIKESYAARRVMIQQKRMKESEEGQPKLETLQKLTHRPAKIEEMDSKVTDNLGKGSDQVVDNSNENQNDVSKLVVGNVDNSQNYSIKLIADNSDTQNVSRIMVNNSDNTQNNISRIMVANSESREKRDTISDSFVAQISTTAKSNFVGGQESLNHVATEHHEGENFKNGNIDSPNLSEDNGENFESRTKNENMDGQSLTEDKDENFESKAEDGNLDRDSLNEENDGKKFNEMRTRNDHLQGFPVIEDELMKP